MRRPLSVRAHLCPLPALPLARLLGAVALALSCAAVAPGVGYVAAEGHYGFDHYTYDPLGQITGCVYYWVPDQCAMISNSHYTCDMSGWGHWNTAVSGYSGGACTSNQLEDTQSGTTPHLVTTFHP
jgi:hypothetical protein